MKQRCINIDWLECYCLEDYIGYPHDAEFFKQKGWLVHEREYGTPVYHEMFTLCTHDEQPFIEIRRNPKSAQGRQLHGVLDPHACHVRLCNRTCYFEQAAKIMSEFLEENGFAFQRISRIDIALDFEQFDSGDKPSKFIARYMANRYAKINQGNIRANGKDMWDGRIWNSLAWGNIKSMVSTKFYNKTMELKERSDKPYIRQAWLLSHLVDDSQDLWKIDAQGRKYYPDIWRVEFSIKSSTRKWFIIEDYSGAKKKIRSIPHTLDMYYTKEQLLSMFFSLSEHYFHFKKPVEIPKKGVAFNALGTIVSKEHEVHYQRKDRCPDKVLFYPKEQAVFYKLENVASADKRDKAVNGLLTKLIEYRETHTMPDIYKACNVLIESIEKERRLADLTKPWPMEELTAIRLLIAQRIKNPDAPFSTTEKLAKALNQIEDDLFGEHDKKR